MFDRIVYSLPFRKFSSAWSSNVLQVRNTKAVVHVHNKILDASPRFQSNFLHFHAVFRKNWLNNSDSLWGLGPHVWEILDLPLQRKLFRTSFVYLHISGMDIAFVSAHFEEAQRSGCTTYQYVITTPVLSFR